MSMTALRTSTLFSYDFTTLQGLGDAITALAHQFPDVSPSEVFPEDSSGTAIGRLRLRRTTLTDESQVYDIVLEPANQALLTPA